MRPRPRASGTKRSARGISIGLKLPFNPTAASANRNMRTSSAATSTTNSSGDGVKSARGAVRSVKSFQPPRSESSTARESGGSAAIRGEPLQIAALVDVDEHARVIAFDGLNFAAVSLEHGARAIVPRQREELVTQRR